MKFGSWSPGRALGVLLCLLVLMTTAAMAATPRTERLIFIDNDNWRGHLIATCDDASGCEFIPASCPFQRALPITLKAGESRVVEDFGRLQCAGSIGLATLTIVSGNPHLTTYALFKDVAGAGIASVELVPVVMTSPPGASPGALLEARFVQNDDNYATTFALFSDGDRSSLATVRVFDETNQLIGIEGLSVSQGFNFIALATKVHAGRLEIAPGTVGWGCNGCDYAPPIGGVAFVNWRKGGSPRAVPLIARASP
ncbi:MAG TPA: hypothetical protein VEZ11_01160 [Thermoanaerobaculia bacterium]|nr:hypothetical protein [Thermoanaerobaculia bacterium]